MQRKNHTPFYFNKEVDQALRECDEARKEQLHRHIEVKHETTVTYLCPTEEEAEECCTD